MKAADADCGIGFDGDGDRIGVIDKNGRQVSGDLLTAFGLDILDRHKGADILFDVKSSSTALNLVRWAGGTPHLWRTGHSHMKQRLKELGAPLAGEMSGHIFISDDFYGFDDALYVACRFLSRLTFMAQNTNESLTDFLTSCRPALPRLNAISAVLMKKNSLLLNGSRNRSTKMPPDQINLIDGVLTTDSGWSLSGVKQTCSLARAVKMRPNGSDDFLPAHQFS